MKFLLRTSCHLSLLGTTAPPLQIAKAFVRTGYLCPSQLVREKALSSHLLLEFPFASDDEAVYHTVVGRSSRLRLAVRAFVIGKPAMRRPPDKASTVQNPHLARQTNETQASVVQRQRPHASGCAAAYGTASTDDTALLAALPSAPPRDIHCSRLSGNRVQAGFCANDHGGKTPSRVKRS